MQAPGFWDDQKAAQGILVELNRLKKELAPFQSLEKEVEDLGVLLDLAREEQEDLSGEIRSGFLRLEKELSEFELKMLLGGKYDLYSAVFSIHAGAGGTESCDWANMLLRMYSRWAEGKGYGISLVDVLPGEEAGIKHATLIVSGEYAYGYLKAERGVHRLVRISPFDANHRRHTSFASVDVIPEMEDEVEVEIRQGDLRVDTYRAGGAGGQHVNVTDSAVRMTHIPTGITAQCQNERSQHQNRRMAMLVLRSRLHDYYQKKRDEEIAEKWEDKEEIGWGSQIRSYVLHPYNLVKDHRTKVEMHDVNRVMDGDIDIFIESHLRKK